MLLRLFGFAALLLMSAPALADPNVMDPQSKRPVKEIARDLGVTTEQFQKCFANVMPTPGGDRPESGTRVQNNKNILLPCLQKANPTITNESLDTVMDRYRPGGRDAQVPRGE